MLLTLPSLDTYDKDWQGLTLPSLDTYDKDWQGFTYIILQGTYEKD